MNEYPPPGQQPMYPPPPMQPSYPPQQPYMPPPPPQQPKKKRGWIWAIVGALIILVCACAGFGALGASKGGTTNTSTLISTQAATAGTAPTVATAQHYKTGQTVKIGSAWQVTLNSVKTSAGQDYSTPKSGNRYLLANVTLKNVGTKEEDASSLLQWKLRDSEGTAYDETIVTFAASAPNGKIEPGSQIKGDLPYEVPTAQHKFTLAFEDNIFSTGQTIWDLSI